MARLARLCAVSIVVAAASALRPAPEQNKSTVAPPSRDPFYETPDWAHTVKPGTILKQRNLPSGLAAFGQSFDKHFQYTQQILYRTTGEDGSASATILTVLVPHNADYSKVVSLQVAEDTASIDCAPSFGFLAASADYPALDAPTVKVHLLLAQAAFSRGWIVVIPDTAGPKAVYPTGTSAAYAVLDGLRAAFHSAPMTNISSNASVGLWGYSGGGSETLDAVRVLPSYAPELHITGAAIGGISPFYTDLADAIAVLNKGPAANLIPVALLGGTAYRPDLREALEKALKPEFRKHFFSALHQCHDANKKTFYNDDILSMFTDPQSAISIFSNASMSPQALSTDMAPKTTPIYWYQLEEDHLVDSSKIIQLVKKWCAAGSHIDFQLETYSGLKHAGYGLVGAPSAVRWLAGAFEGRAERGGCSNKTVSTPQIEPHYSNMFPKQLQANMKLFVSRV
ncbi:hypothetical protein XA68_14819 [Ophiocordyceps unilateralis]|uniref:Lipase n=1 Tax=Ophiocordyceps unilateralis TaxID=268505 RepID=A0A2A9PMQ1_OPHUN|nr:hypothetical protein XA68_14819 [Ophiocordyceps unilateralis]